MSQDKSPPPINPATNEDKNARLWPGTNEDWPREIEVRSLGMLWWATVQPQIPQLRVNQTDPRPCVWFHYVSLVDLVDATSDSPDNSGYQVKLLAALVPWEVPFQLLFWSKDSLFSENHTIHDTKCLVGGSSNWQQLGYFGSQLRSSWVIQICLKLCVAGHLNDSDPYNGWKIGIPILAPDWNIMECHHVAKFVFQAYGVWHDQEATYQPTQYQPRVIIYWHDLYFQLIVQISTLNTWAISTILSMNHRI